VEFRLRARAEAAPRAAAAAQEAAAQAAAAQEEAAQAAVVAVEQPAAAQAAVQRAAQAEEQRAVRVEAPGCTVEVLIPDFRGSAEALEVVLEARPDILNHNIETVRRLFRQVRPSGRYERSLELFTGARSRCPDLVTKSGIILGMGEERREVLETMGDLRAVDVNVLTLGQYLRPSTGHWPVIRFYRPEEFDDLRAQGLAMGFPYVEADPLVRSSYHAKQQARSAQAAATTA
jgi:lipoic acid synthetase